MNRVLHTIINPASGNGRARRQWPDFKKRIEAQGFEIIEYVTTGPEDASQFAGQLARQSVDEILVVGGDGTTNEVVNGCFENGCPISPELVLSIVPCGTGRDFSRNLGIKNADQAISLLSQDTICTIDLGLLRYRNGDGPIDRCFVNVADVGLGAEAAAWINKTTKALGGFFAYLVGATRTILVFKGKPARVVVDGKVVHDGPVGMIVIANGRFHAGGMLMAPMASMTDGKLEILIVDDVPKHTLLTSLLPKVYRGKHMGHPAVQHLSAEEIDVQAVSEMPFEVDGEQPGTTDIRVTVLPKALRVRAPACR